MGRQLHLGSAWHWIQTILKFPSLALTTKWRAHTQYIMLQLWLTQQGHQKLIQDQTTLEWLLWTHVHWLSQVLSQHRLREPTKCWPNRQWTLECGAWCLQATTRSTPSPIRLRTVPTTPCRRLFLGKLTRATLFLRSIPTTSVMLLPSQSKC